MEAHEASDPIPIPCSIRNEGCHDEEASVSRFFNLEVGFGVRRRCPRKGRICSLGRTPSGSVRLPLEHRWPLT